MFQHLLNAISAKLQSDVPALKYADRDWGQMALHSPAVKYPACLVDIARAEYRNLGNRCQDGEVTVTVAVYGIRLSASSSGAPAEAKARAADLWPVVSDVNKALHCQPLPFPQGVEGFGQMVRQSMVKDELPAGITKITTTYAAHITDSSTARHATAITNYELKITPDISRNS